MGRPREASRAADVDVVLLGGFAVRVAGRPVPERWRLRKAKTLIKMLALADGHRMHRDDLAGRLWPDLAGPAAVNNLYQALHAARRALAAAGAPASTLELRDEIVALCPDGELHVDALTFEGAARHAVGGDLEVMREALDVWTGEPLPEDRYEDWAAATRERLIAQWAGLTADTAEALAGSGEGDAAVALMTPLVARRPLDEHVQRVLMTALVAAGRQRDALDVYDRLHEVLDRELATEPERETRRLREAILTATAPTPGAGPKVRAGVPSPTSSLVGRAREIAALDAELDTARLVTLTGPAGAGKTRLAIELARRRAVAGRHSDGVRLVELAGVREADLVVSSVASALGLCPHGTAPLTPLVEQLGEREVLLVLDNAEHLLSACARLAAAFLAGCPRLTVIATSREPLGMHGETTWRVPSLQLPAADADLDLDRLATLESVQLFVERARGAVPDFGLDAVTAGPIVRICRGLDGIPLALELAAARLAHLSVSELADRLHDAVSLLSYSPAGRLDRQRTMAATLDWSRGLLTGPQSDLLGRLAVFAGGFDLAAVLAVAGDLGPDLDQLARLVDKSLVVADTTGPVTRYRLLEIVRQHAAAAVDHAERQTARRRHRDFFAARARQEDPDRARNVVAEPSDWFDVEHDNLRAALAAALADEPAQALEIAVSMWRFWMSRGGLAEGLQWLERALAACPDRSALRGRALYAVAVLDNRLGFLGSLPALGAELVALSEAGGRRDELAAARHQQAVLAAVAGDWAATDALCAQTLTDAAGVPAVLVTAHHLAAVMTMGRGDLDTAGAHLAAAQEALAAVAPDAAPFFTTLTMAVVVQRWEGWRLGVSEETMLLGRLVGATQADGYLAVTRALHARLTGDLEAALDLLEQAGAVFGLLQDRYGEAFVAAQRGHTMRWLGEHAAARRNFNASEQLRTALGDLRGTALAWTGTALTDAADGRAGPARSLAARALAAVRRVGDTAGIAHALCNAAVVEILLGDHGAAEAFAEEQCRATLGRPGWHRGTSWQHLLLAQVHDLRGDRVHAARELGRAQRMFRQLGDRAGVAAVDGLVAEGAGAKGLQRPPP